MQSSQNDNRIAVLCLVAGFRGIALLPALCCLVPAAATAQGDADIRDTVQECRSMPDNFARLACYDAAFPPGSGRSADRQAADVGSPRSSRVAPAAPEPQPNVAIPAQPSVFSIVEVRTVRPTGMVRFYAADGRVFAQTSGSSRLNLPDPPFDVELETGAFGSMFLRIAGRNLRVRVAAQE